MQPKKKNAPTRLQAALVVGGSLLCIAAIVFLKTAADNNSPAHAKVMAEAVRAAENRSDSTADMAIPDTVGDISALPAMPDSVPPAMPDSVGRDTRSASNAGREDGFLAGSYDASQGAHRASFDDTNTFPTPAEQRAYEAAYREGYEHGYAEARAQAESGPPASEAEAPRTDAAGN